MIFYTEAAHARRSEKKLLPAEKSELEPAQPTKPTNRQEILDELQRIQESVDVSEFSARLPYLISLLTLECESFQAGRISNYLSEWRKITSDPQILSYVTGVEIERKGLPQEKESLTQRETRFTDKEKSLIEEEISSLLRKKVIETAKPCVGEVIFNTKTRWVISHDIEFEKV